MTSIRLQSFRSETALTPRAQRSFPIGMPLLIDIPRALAMVVCVMLAGCAGQMAYRDGKSLVASGNTEEAVKKFQEAVSADPQSVPYRVAWVLAKDRAVQGLVEMADQALADGRPGAEVLYRRALVLTPQNERARDGLARMDADQRHTQALKEAIVAQTRGDTLAAEAKLGAILAENPRHADAQALRRQIAASASPPASVGVDLSAAYKKPISIDFKDVTLKQFYEVVARTSGLNILFDRDVRMDQKTSIFMRNSNVESVLYFVQLTNQLNHQVLDANTILVYPNTPEKQRQYQELVVKTFMLSNADAKTVGATLKAIVKSRDMVVDDRLNMIIVRDSPEAIRLAAKLVALHDVPEPEVMLEVEILEVKRSRLMELGIRWPDSLTLTPLAATGGGALTVSALSEVSSSSLGVTPPVFTINARKQDGATNILANPRIRTRNREKATIMIGDRVPNITTTSSSTGFVGETITYIDVGLKLEVEPTIYLDNDVAIRVVLEVSNIVNQIQTKSGSLAYQIGTRNASTVLRLKDGENQILAGLINDQDRNSRNKVPGFGELPVLGRLFGSGLDDSQKTEIVLSITPRLIRNIQRPEAAKSEFQSGTETGFRPRPQGISGLSAAPGGATNLNPTPTALPPGNASAISQVNVNPFMSSIEPSSTPSVTITIPSGTPSVSRPTGQPLKFRWEGPTQVGVGEVFTVQLHVESAAALTGLPLVLSFDPGVLQVQDVSEGDFLRQAGAETRFASTTMPGQVLVTATRLGQGGASGAGQVVTLRLRALAVQAITTLQLVTTEPVGIAGGKVELTLPQPLVIRVTPGG